MTLSENDLAELLGVTPAEIALGATWRLSGVAGGGVTASIVHDDETGDVFVQVSEGVAGEDGSSVAWLSGTWSDEGFELAGHETTGEFSDSEDPRGAATVIRRQISAIRNSEAGRKVA